MIARRLANYVAHLALLILFTSPIVVADDWPMWRYDAARSAASPNELESELGLVWEKQFSERTQAWDDPLNLDLMTYDRVFEPIVIDGRLIIGFNDRDKVVAMDTETGQELWTFYTEAPVRMPPAGSAGQVYFTSDDGYLYCVDAADGKLRWKFNGAPNSQHAIGNRRLPGRPAVVRSCATTPSTLPPAFGPSWAHSSMHLMHNRVKSAGSTIAPVPSTSNSRTAPRRLPGLRHREHWSQPNRC